MAYFTNRRQAGRKLAGELQKYKGRDNVIVLGLPRGGVPVAYEVAEALEAHLDVFVVRKLGVPTHPELAMGAIASGGVKVTNDNVIQQAGVSEEQIEDVVREEKQELEEREKLYRGSRPDIDLEGKTVILVDDGMATGASMRAALKALKKHNPKKVIIAVPTAPKDSCEEFRSKVDEMICLQTPTPFWGVGGSYQDFSQTTNQEVRELLEKSEV